MKNLRKIIAVLLMLLISIGNTYATGFPDEPMVIYGNVTGVSNGVTMKIYDGENNLLKSINISDGKYGTDKTFDIDNKILLNTYNGILSFKIDGYDFSSISKGEITTCETESSFQKGNICEYNLSFEEIIVAAPIVRSSGGGGGGGGSSSSSSSSSDLKTTNKTTTIKTETTNKKVKSETKVKRNEEGKIVIKGKDYIKNVRMFDTNKKTTKKVFGHKILNIKGDDGYNKKVITYTKKIHNKIKLDSIRKNILRTMDQMTRTYGILTDSELDESLKDTYKAKLVEDREYFDLKLKKMIRKDEIIRYTLEKRKLEK